MLRPEVRHIFRTGRPTKYELNLVHIRSTKTRISVKGQGRKVTWCVWQVLADKSRTKRSIGSPKLVGGLSTPRLSRVIKRPRFKVKGQRSRSPGRLMLRPEVRHIFRTGRPMNFKLNWYTDGARRPVSATSAVTSKVKGQGRKVTWRVW